MPKGRTLARVGLIVGLAAAIAGWDVEDTLLTAWADGIAHEGRGPKRA